MRRNYKVLLEQDEDGIFIARVPELPGCVSNAVSDGYATKDGSVPELPGCVSNGKTKDKALKRVKEAIEGFLGTPKEEVSLKNNFRN